MIKINETELIVDEVRCQYFVGLINSVLGYSAEQISMIAPAWHWLFTHATPERIQLGLDGHPRELPIGVPENFTRRLWASSFLQFKKPIQLRQKLRCRTTIETATLKTGRSGELAFVPVQIEIVDNDSIVLTERRIGVYRPPVSLTQLKCDHKKSIPEKKTNSIVSKSVVFTEVSLFRYSALIQVAHRIHYDYLYTTTVEGYPGLVIHGPFLAQILICFALHQYPGLNVQSITVQALKPNFLGTPVILNLGSINENNCLIAWSEDLNGATTMELELNLSSQ